MVGNVLNSAVREVLLREDESGEINPFSLLPKRFQTTHRGTGATTRSSSAPASWCTHLMHTDRTQIRVPRPARTRSRASVCQPIDRDGYGSGAESRLRRFRP